MQRLLLAEMKTSKVNSDIAKASSNGYFFCLGTDGPMWQPELVCLEMHLGPCKELLGGNASRQSRSLTVTDSPSCALTGAQGRQRQPWRNGKCWSPRPWVRPAAQGVPLFGHPKVPLGSTAPTWALAQSGGVGLPRGQDIHMCAHTYVHTQPRVHINTHSTVKIPVYFTQLHSKS